MTDLRDIVAADLRRDEDCKLKAYRCPAGRLTIGIGRNVEDVGITQEEAEYLLEHDLDRVMLELDRELPWWRTMPAAHQRGLMNMAFNLGITRLMHFKGMLGALQAGDGPRAAGHALASRWAAQVGPRAYRIAALYRGA